MTENITKLATLIEGFDYVTMGGLPEGRTTLVTGTAGSGKTVFGAQYLALGIEQRGETGVFVSFEETANSIRRNMSGFSWDIAKWEKEGKWTFIDVSPAPGEQVYISGDYDLDSLLARILVAIKKTNAKRLCLDSISALFTQFDSSNVVRRELFRIVSRLNEVGVTTVLTAERQSDYGEIARFGVEEFVSDNVIILRNVLAEEKRRRTIEVLKFRGTNHLKGEFPFTILPQGIVVIPLAALQLEQKSSDRRISSGNSELDQMCGGGFFQDSIILVSGATGTGKTLTASAFMAYGAAHGERSLMLAYEESREQLFRNARGWGMDFDRLEKQGLLKAICIYPEALGLEDHLLAIKNAIHEFKPTRLAIDSVSALERVSTVKSFREFNVGLTSFLKHEEVSSLFTSTTPSLMGGTSVTEAHISSITDTIVLLRYVEAFGEMKRGLAVLKMRGSMHDKNIREFNIDNQGLHIGKPFREVSGILSGRNQNLSAEEVQRLSGLFRLE